jgi:hypothetical protein
MIDMAFAKKRVDDRKLWLLALEPGSVRLGQLVMERLQLALISFALFYYPLLLTFRSTYRLQRGQDFLRRLHQ